MIRIYGYLGAASEQLRDVTAAADLVVGSRRAIEELGVSEDRAQILGTIGPAIERIKALPDTATTIVLASGDPLLFGVVRRMRQAGLRVEVVPTVSSLQAAFAKVSLPWDDAQLISAHAGGLDTTLRTARVHPKVGVLTAPGRTIVEMAAGLRGLGKTFVVAERLGESNERVRVLSEDEALALTSDDVLSPHVVLILSHHPDSMEALGVPPELQGDAEAAADGAPKPGENTAPDGSDKAPIIGQVYNTDLSAAHADRIDAALGIETKRYVGPSARGLVAAWSECDLIVSHLALGATVRLIAPLLETKYADPGVVVLDEGGRFAVPVVGGHVGGANDLARQIGAALGSTAVVTTATDSLGIPALDQLGWAFAGDVAGVTGSIIAGRPVQIVRERPWLLPPLPSNVADDVAEPLAQIVLSDRVPEQIIAEASVPTVVL
ncbi:MAG: precorrin-6y C5,15-methyltransferase (decarboxylating) subunit CbiE, partial [Propionibacteriaceae bacterium]